VRLDGATISEVRILMSPKLRRLSGKTLAIIAPDAMRLFAVRKAS
jgi:hypothetical protein